MIGEHVMNNIPHPTIYNSPVLFWFVRLALLWAFVAAVAWGMW